MSRLYEKLVNYDAEGIYPFHMPGHKRKIEMTTNPYLMDLTEIDGFDNLHDAKELIKESQLTAARLFCAKETHFLVNGSTCGIEAAIFSATKTGGRILIARNCHKSVYHACELRQLQVSYVYPQYFTQSELVGDISPDAVKEAFVRWPDIEAVVITSPTYDGVISDIRSIAECVHEKGAVLIVDEAHGAHLGLHQDFSKNSNQCGADLVIQSIHKTLPAPTQTALLHINGNLINGELVNHYLHVFQTSSPSYLLMAGIDKCIQILEEETTLFQKYCTKLYDFYKKMSSLQKLHVLTAEEILKEGAYAFDFGKVVISVKNADISGKELQELLLNRYHLQMEMATENYVLAMTSVMDTNEGFFRLSEALFEIDSFVKRKKEYEEKEPVIFEHGMQVVPIGVAACGSSHFVRLEDCIDQISAEYVCPYPPGIPWLVPGEMISQKIVKEIKNCIKQGMTVTGIEEEEIAVLWEKSIVC